MSQKGSLAQERYDVRDKGSLHQIKGVGFQSYSEFCNFYVSESVEMLKQIRQDCEDYMQLSRSVFASILNVQSSFQKHSSMINDVFKDILHHVQDDGFLMVGYLRKILSTKIGIIQNDLFVATSLSSSLQNYGSIIQKNLDSGSDIRFQISDYSALIKEMLKNGKIDKAEASRAMEIVARGEFRADGIISMIKSFLFHVQDNISSAYSLVNNLGSSFDDIARLNNSVSDID